jgi:t-SNARE complex subunit (syntaxin)
VEVRHMEVKVEELSFKELIDLFNAMNEFVEFLKIEETTEVEKRK